MFDLMLNLDKPVHDEGPLSFFEKQRLGFLRVREEGRDRIMQRLERVEELDYNSLEKHPKILMRDRWIARCMGKPEGGL